MEAALLNDHLALLDQAISANGGTLVSTAAVVLGETAHKMSPFTRSKSLAYCAVQPPSTGRITPVTRPESL